jgi:hypothetical protein
MTRRRQIGQQATRNHSEAGSTPIDQHLTTRDLARRWQVSVKKLENDRWRGGGVPFVRIGAAVRYRLADVLAFEEASLICSTSASRSPGGSP